MAARREEECPESEWPMGEVSLPRGHLGWAGPYMSSSPHSVEFEKPQEKLPLPLGRGGPGLNERVPSHKAAAERTQAARSPTPTGGACKGELRVELYRAARSHPVFTSPSHLPRWQLRKGSHHQLSPSCLPRSHPVCTSPDGGGCPPGLCGHGPQCHRHEVHPGWRQQPHRQGPYRHLWGCPLPPGG